MVFENKYKIIKKGEEEFPAKLYDLKNCPEKLLTLGDLNLLKNFSIAIVGARRCEDKSAQYAKKISFELSRRGIVIVSGLANGIDSIAHESCLDAKGKTIAVLGGGFNQIYPKENITLLEKILEMGGLIISEYEPDAAPIGYRFLERNRLIAALSDGVILIQAKEKSGSMTTAKNAKKLKRKLFVIPGAMDNPNFNGSNILLSDGATCILNYKDVLNGYDRKFRIRRNVRECLGKHENSCEGIPEEYMEIYKSLLSGVKTINQISVEVQLPISDLSSKLTFMEMDGYIKQLPGKCFSINKENRND